MPKDAKDFLPLSQATYYILTSLREERHGYGIIKDVEVISKGEVVLGPGTLYGALGKLEKQDIIKKVINQKDTRRKYYELTEFGKEVWKLEFQRLYSLVENTKDIIKFVEGDDIDRKKV